MENETGAPPNEEVSEKIEERVGNSSNASPGSSPSAGARMEVSAQTIARMMGIASATDLQLLEGRLDLLTSRVSTLMMKVDKVLSNFGAVASVGDVSRLETQIASLKSLVREAVDVVGTMQNRPSAPQKESGESQGRKLREGIRTSSES